jgi:hypothetical protein
MADTFLLNAQAVTSESPILETCGQRFATVELGDFQPIAVALQTRDADYST